MICILQVFLLYVIPYLLVNISLYRYFYGFQELNEKDDIIICDLCNGL